MSSTKWRNLEEFVESIEESRVLQRIRERERGAARERALILGVAAVREAARPRQWRPLQRVGRPREDGGEPLVAAAPRRDDSRHPW